MPIYTVSLCRDTVEFCDVEVEADTEAEAEEIALKIARSPKNDLYWEADGNSAKDPEINETLFTREGN